MGKSNGGKACGVLHKALGNGPMSQAERKMHRKGIRKEERRILLLQEQRKAAAPGPRPKSAKQAPMSKAAEVPQAPPAVSVAADEKARLAEAAARGLGGGDPTQQLRRLARAHEQDAEARQQVAATTMTPAAASLLAALRAGGV